MFLWDCVLALLLLPAAPFFYMINLCMIHNHENRSRLGRIYHGKNIIAHNGKNTLGIMASPKEYTDVWTRRFLFHVGCRHFPKHPHFKDGEFVGALSAFGRSCPLVHRERFGVFQTGLSCARRFSSACYYGDAKTGNMVTDSCSIYHFEKGTR